MSAQKDFPLHCSVIRPSVLRSPVRLRALGSCVSCMLNSCPAHAYSPGFDTAYAGSALQRNRYSLPAACQNKQPVECAAPLGLVPVVPSCHLFSVVFAASREAWGRRTELKLHFGGRGVNFASRGEERLIPLYSAVCAGVKREVPTRRHGDMEIRR